MCVGDERLPNAQFARMVTHDELMETLHAWIAGGRIRPGDVAKELGIPSPRVSEMLGGRRRIQQDEMPVLSRLLGLDDEPESNVRRVKRIGQVPAGQLQQALDESADMIDVSVDLPKGVFALEVSGESMNLVAPFGADVIVDPNDKNLFADDFYVVGDGSGEFTLKLFKQDPARLVPLSDNPAYRIIPLGGAPVDIVGRVVSVSLNAGALRRMGKQIGAA